MKKIIILLIALLILHHLSFAEKVNIETVKKIAVKVFIENYPGSDKDEIVIERAIPFTTENEIDHYEVKIYNNLNVAVFQTGKTKESLLRINTRQFQNGVYFIHFIAGKKINVKQLVVSH